MERNLFSVLSALLLVGLISCDRTGGLLPNNSLDDITNVAGNVNGQSLVGRLIASTSAQNTVTLMIKSDTAKSEYATYAIVLQREAGGKSVKFELEKAQIIMTPVILYVNSVNTEEKYLFKIKTDEADNTINLLPDNYKKGSSVYDGYGLSYRWGAIPFNIDKYVTSLGGGARQALKSCGAGGRGSTSCSVQGGQPCSVSCQAGYYVCCNTSLTLKPDCSCIPN